MMMPCSLPGNSADWSTEGATVYWNTKRNAIASATSFRMFFNAIDHRDDEFEDAL